MGGTCSRQKPLRFLIQGLDAAGKTSILYKLKLGEVVTTIPTIGFNVETVYSNGVEITGWDLGGRDKIRPLYRHYYPGTDGLIYVIDSADVDRIDDALDELEKYILQNEDLQESVIMVAANKQDLDNVLSPEEIESKVKERCKFAFGCSLFVMPCSVMTEHSLQVMFEHFIKQIKLKKAGELQSGLIPSAWKMTKPTENDKNDDAAAKGDDSETIIHRMKNSLFKDPFNLFKSFLFY